MRIGVLTGGGDCPGLNAVIRAVVRKGEVEHGDSFVGFRDGWKGLTENLTRPLDVELCRGILPRGGTILGTSRTNPYKVEGGVEAVKATLEQHDVDALVAIGGDDTLGVAYKLSQTGVDVIGVPKTIDNDLSATEVTFGFHTAVQIATDAIDRLHTTAESHDRVFVCEVMGRHAGWIAMYAGMAGGAAEILIPEQPFDIDEVAPNSSNVTAKVASRRSSSWPRVPSPRRAPSPSPAARSTPSATPSSEGSASAWPTHSRSAPATRRARPSWATSNEAGRRPRTTASLPPALGSGPSAPCTRAPSA
jgi:6-phosphofructokinase